MTAIGVKADADAIAHYSNKEFSIEKASCKFNRLRSEFRSDGLFRVPQMHKSMPITPISSVTKSSVRIFYTLTSVDSSYILIMKKHKDQYLSII